MTYVKPLPAVEWRGPTPPTASIRDGRGPERVDTDHEDAKFVRRPVGFTAKLVEPDPKLWDGDNA